MAKPKLDWIIRTSPIAPDLTSSTELRRLRVQAVHEGLAAKVPALRAAWIIASTSKAVSAIGFSHQHVLAGLRRLDRPFGVARMRRRDVDRVDLRVVEQRLVAVEDAGARESLRRGPPCPDCACRSRRAVPVRESATPPAKVLGDGARPDDAPADSSVTMLKSCQSLLERPCGLGCGCRMPEWSAA